MIKSEIPCTPCRKTLSASRKASSIGVFLSTTSNKRLFEIINNVSTFSFKRAIPSAAKRPRFGPSKVNGRVTTPTVNAPNSFAIPATIGAAPVPVPPPIPAVMKIISAPSKASRKDCSLSSAAFCPTSG